MRNRESECEPGAIALDIGLVQSVCRLDVCTRGCVELVACSSIIGEERW